MDVQFIAVVVIVVAAVTLSARRNARWMARPGYQYQRVFSAGAGGLLFFVAGLIGWDLRHNHGFQGTTWVSGRVWWEIALGLGLLFLAGRWARQVWVRAEPV